MSERKVKPSQFLANANLKLPHHMAFFQRSLERLEECDPDAFAVNGELYGIWAGEPSQKEPLIPAQPAPAAPARPGGPSAQGKPPAAPQAPSRRILQVPYEYQNDNLSGTGYRECFSSSCAMIAKFYGRVQSDDQYNKIRAKFGDSTDAGAQSRALESLGLVAQLKQNGSAATLEKIIEEGRPIPVGWLHKGSVNSPSGGGHWSVIIGYDKQSFVHNDPNGEADMVNGGYVSTRSHAGRGVVYSRTNWLHRWEVDGPGSGWYMDVKVR